MEKKSGRPRMIGPQTKRTFQAEDCRKRKLKEAALEGDEKIKRMQHDFDEGKNRIAQLERMIQMIHQEWKLKYQKLERELTMVKRALQRPTYLGMQGSLEQNYNGSYSDPEMGFARLDPQMVHHQGYDTSAQHQNSYALWRSKKCLSQ
uniref:BZIP domain-containing protein n=1 Tax=Steinernema glaseri TaxID=37863 RepID=A0A1I8AGW4_9BILA